VWNGCRWDAGNQHLGLAVSEGFGGAFEADHLNLLRHVQVVTGIQLHERQAVRHVAVIENGYHPVGLAVLIVIRQGDHCAIAGPAQEQDALIVERYVPGLGNVIREHRQADTVRDIQFQIGRITRPAAAGRHKKHPNQPDTHRPSVTDRDASETGILNAPKVHSESSPVSWYFLRVRRCIPPAYFI